MLAAGIQRVFVSAELSTYWSSNDVSALKKSASQIASSSSSAGDVYYSLQFLNSFDAKSSCDCNNIKAVAKASTTAIDAYYALTSGDLCNCGLKSISKKFNDLALISSVCCLQPSFATRR